MSMPKQLKQIKQCATCPWRVGADPYAIPGYSEEMHRALRSTIADADGPLFPRHRSVMACHHTKPGRERTCAGWMHHQLGPGNNIGLRLAMLSGQKPVPVVDGPQHQRFEDTLPTRKRSTSKTPTAKKKRTT